MNSSTNSRTYATKKKRKSDKVLRSILWFFVGKCKQDAKNEHFSTGAYIDVRDREKAQVRQSIAPHFVVFRRKMQARREERAPFDGSVHRRTRPRKSASSTKYCTAFCRKKIKKPPRRLFYSLLRLFDHCHVNSTQLFRVFRINFRFVRDFLSLF